MEKASTNALEQFILLSKSAKGAASAELVKQAVETPGLYVFGELLDSTNIKEVKSFLFVSSINFDFIFKNFLEKLN